VSIVRDPVIHTPSHRIHAFSNFDLTFGLPQKKRLVKLTLQPSHGVIAEGASVQYLNPDGEVARTETIDRAAHKIFKGDAWMELDDGTWRRVGSARIAVHRDGDNPLFEGVKVHADQGLWRSGPRGG
jgi:hypothetical protein